MKISVTTAFAAALAATLPAAAWAGGDIHKTPPAAFKKVSGLVPLPDYLPGMGTLHVDPATLPAGPFLGYDKSGRLVNVIYMVPTKDFEQRKALLKLGTAAAGLKVDHTDIEFNPGHPGVAEPHYHITQWLIGHEEHEKRLK